MANAQCLMAAGLRSHGVCSWLVRMANSRACWSGHARCVATYSLGMEGTEHCSRSNVHAVVYLAQAPVRCDALYCVRLVLYNSDLASCFSCIPYAAPKAHWCGLWCFCTARGECEGWLHLYARATAAVLCSIYIACGACAYVHIVVAEALAAYTRNPWAPYFPSTTEGLIKESCH